MSGHLGDLSEYQYDKLCILRNKIWNEVMDANLRGYAEGFCDDGMLLRFLRARKFDVNAAYDMLFSTLVFRTTFQGIGVDAIGVQSVMNEVLQGKSFFYGADKEGRPVCIVRVKHHDPSKSDFLESQRFSVFMMEFARKLLRPPIETVSLIFDMTDAGMRNIDMKALQFLVYTLQNHYPESLGKILVYNASWFVHGIWKVVRPWLDAVTAAKVFFVDKRNLRDYITEQNLTVDYGGRSPYKFNAEEFVSQVQQYPLAVGPSHP